jgi:uncharacterized Zn-finger protein
LDETTNSTETTIFTDSTGGDVTNNGLKTADILEENLEVENNNQSKYRPDFVNLVKIRLRRKKVIVKSNDSEQKVESNKNTANLKHNINLKRSMKTKSRNMPYLCRFCKKRFIQKSHWEDHERIHTGEKPYSCKYCSKAFKQSGNLLLHERIHTGEKPYSCKSCSKAFNHSSNLIQHERIHTGEKPYSCNYCSKAFIQSTQLTRHELSHTGVKPY